MEWSACMREVLRTVEEHLRDGIDIGTVSKAVYVSPYYLQRGFQCMTGYSLGEYIRNRRLYEAARELADTGDKVIDVALRYGYDTPESFSKAFTRFHGATPAAVRGDPTLIRSFLPLHLHIILSGGNNMDYVVSPAWGMKFIGFEREFSLENGYAEIPKFWDEICEKYCNHTIYAGLPPQNAAEQAIIDNCIGEFAVCIDTKEDGTFRYIIAGRYTGGEVPEGMTLVELPQGDWAKFRCVGPIPEAFQALNTRVFREWLPGNPDYEIAGNYNLEWYSCDGEKTDPDYRSEIWVPVKKKG